LTAAIAEVTTAQEVRKHASAIHVSGDLGLLERKLINVLLLNAYDDLLTQKTHTISVAMLLEMINWKASKNLDNLKDALLKIMTTTIVFDVLHKDPKKSKWGAMNPLSYAEIENGVCSYRYDSGLAEKLAKPDVYAIININIQKRFASSYALALYENCLRFRRVGSTGFIDLKVWRGLLGAQASVYDEFKYLSQRVLKEAVAEVNAVSNINLTMDKPQREGRKVVALKFLISEKAQQSIDDIPDDPDETVLSTETFKLLRECGIGAKLAVHWIKSEPERALWVARVTVEKASKNLLTRSAGGYARTIFENGSVIEDVIEKKSVDQATHATASTHGDTDADVRAKETRAAVAALTPEERATLAQEFIAVTGPDLTYDPVKDKVGGMIETRKYRDFTRERASTVIALRESQAV
jgi:plasmid replication initiation protein